MRQELLPCVQAVHHESFDLLTTADLTGMHPEMILEFSRSRMVRSQPSANGAPRFDQHAIFRLRQIATLRQHHSMRLRSIRLVLELVDRLEAAEAELRRLAAAGR